MWSMTQAMGQGSKELHRGKKGITPRHKGMEQLGALENSEQSGVADGGAQEAAGEDSVKAALAAAWRA